jgi:tetratricopeptide (TPR) repeat protein
MVKTKASGLIFFIFLTVLAGCSTKNNFVNRTFHNLSAHYNGYFNAGLKLEEAQTKLALLHEDKYDRVLSVFKYGDRAKAKTVFPLLDDAMKRTSLVISRHTILSKNGNEIPTAEKWIDDNWLVYGKCQFFKHEYFDAIETFKYIEGTYKTEPTRFAASLWLAKTYLELTQLRDAEDRLDYLRNQKDLPRNLRGEFEAVAADFYLQTKNVEKGIEHLTKASVYARKREDRIRYMFILGQLHERQGDFKTAFGLYTQVIKKNPPYEMDFNARINRARCSDAQGKGGETVKKELLRMMKDPKNKDYMDQIYYALAGISEKENKEDEAIDYLSKSVKVSTSNANQKAISYLELAKIYFARPEYKKAQAYYDSTITYLSNDHPSYSDILNIRNSLTKLVKYLNTIQLEDSLQHLASLSPEDRQKIIADKIKKDEEDAKKKKEELEEQQVNQIFSQNQGEVNQFNTQPGSNWYFYNAQAISFGLNEFTKKWGNRKLEDNWRRSGKETVAENETEPEEKDTTQVTEKEVKETPDQKQQNLLKTVPVTPEALAKSTNKIVDAYYNAGMIYKDQLNNLPEAAKMFEELNQKYPANKYELQCYYQLYRIYLALNNNTKSDYYKNIILTQHGDSEYAQIIRNPNYAAELAGRKSNLEIYYEETYRKYLNGEYASVIQRKSESDILFPQSPLLPKFDYLKALSIGKTQPVQTFITSLGDIIRNYSNDPVKDQAQDILDFIHGSSSEVKNEPPALDTAKRLYTYFPDTAQFIVIAFQNIGGPIKSDTLLKRLSDYNSKYYGTKEYAISSLMFDHRLKIVIVKEFANKAEALEYYNGLLNNDEVYGNLNPDSYNQLIVSTNNFAPFIIEKKLDDYIDFFNRFYK